MIGFQNVVKYSTTWFYHSPDFFRQRINPMKYELRKSLTPEALRLTVQSLLMDLGNVDADEMTTFELHMLHALADNPPAKRHGVEWPKG